MKRGLVDNVNDNSGELFESIHAIMHLFRSRQYRGVRGGAHELTHMEGKLLDFFARNPGATLSNLSAHSARDKGQLARLLKSLKQAKLISPQKQAMKDRRRIGLELTPAGKIVHKTVHRQKERLITKAVNGLNDTERRQLLHLLLKVRANLEEITAP